MSYAEFCVATNFSFLRGASHPEELVLTAGALRLSGLGVADRNSLAGVVRMYAARKEIEFEFDELRVVTGCRLVFADGTPDILVYPQNRAAYARLSRLLTTGMRRAAKGDCILNFLDLLQWSEGQFFIVIPPYRVDAATRNALGVLNDKYPRRVWLGAAFYYCGDDQRRMIELQEVSANSGIPLLATNDVLYHAPNRRQLHDVLTCVLEKEALQTIGKKLQKNAERYIHPPAEMTRRFRHMPNALRQTNMLLEQIEFDLSQVKYNYPDESCEGFETPQAALEAFTWAGAARRYPGGVPDKVQRTIRREFELIEKLNYAPYFLTVHHIVNYAREKNILAQGRGSAANSAVCFCLGVTEIDPNIHNLLFERFISAERNEPPDIDIDFEHERREDVIQHVYQRYGREHVALTSTVVTYGSRMAIRDVGKVFGLSDDTLGALAGSIWQWSKEGVEADDAARIGFDASDPTLSKVIALARELINFPRHLSQHTGGMVIAKERLDELVPIQNAAMDNRTVIEWNKDDLETLGLLKVDILALGMLSAMKRFYDLLEASYGLSYTTATLPPEDPAVYRMLQRADSTGVFQVESRAQQNMLPRLKPEKFFDLVIEVAIVRPGPIQGDMVHPYLRRKTGKEKVVYPSKELEEVLSQTLGVPLFQEQCMKIAIVAAGFTPDEADRLRRAMATFKRVGTIQSFNDKMVNGMIARGYDREFAERCFSQIEGFGTYGFPMSHAASFALLVYASSWVKCRYPDVFLTGLLNAQPMGFYAPAQLVRDAQEHGVEVREVDINFSDWETKLETGEIKPLHPRHKTMLSDIRGNKAVRLGFKSVRGIREEHGLLIAELRGQGYDSVRDLWLRTRLPVSLLETLAEADMFRSLGIDRRDALWAVQGLRRAGDKDDLPLLCFATTPLESDARLPPMFLGQHVVEDYRTLGMSLKSHPIAFVRDSLSNCGVTTAEALSKLRNGASVAVAGLVLVRQRPGSAKGVIFLTLEDETANANVIVWTKTFETYRAEVLGARLLVVRGRLQSSQGVVHVIAQELEDKTHFLKVLNTPHESVQSFSNADEVRRPQSDRRSARSRVALNLSLEQNAMPKGRNFR